MSTSFFLYWKEKKVLFAEFSKKKNGVWKIEKSDVFNFLLEKNQPLFTAKELARFQEALTACKSQCLKIHCFLPAHKAFIKTIPIEVPPGLENILPRLITCEAKYIFPLPLSKLVWNYKIFASTQVNKVNVTYIATKKEFLDSLIEVIPEDQLSRLIILATPIAIQRTLEIIDQNHGSTLILNLEDNVSNILLQESNNALTSYTLAPLLKEGVELNLHTETEEKIITSLLSLLKYLKSKKIIPNKIFLVGENTHKNQLFSYLQKNLIETFFLDDLDQLVELHPLFDFTISSFIKKNSISSSVIFGGITFFEKKCCLDLCPPILLTKKNQKRESSYFLGAVFLVIFTFLLWSFYWCYEINAYHHKINQAKELFDQRKSQLIKSDKIIEKFKKIEETKLVIFHFIEAHNLWIKIVNELQNALPKRYIWITKLSPISNQEITNEYVSTRELELEGLYLENPRQSEVINDFINELKKSALFLIDKPEQILLSYSSADGSAYAYPFKIHLILKNPIQLKIQNK